MSNNLILTDEEHKILESYKTVIDGLSDFLGDSYEITLHSLEDYNHSVIKIVNGFHTGRTIGSPITDLALFWLNKIETDNSGQDYFSYFSKNKIGEPLKSTTIAIRGNENRIIGLLCINLYLGTPLIHYISDFIPKDITSFTSESFIDNPNNTIKQELDSAKKAVINDTSIPPTQRNKEIIRLLQSKRIFEIKNSIEQVANELNISINTVYFHLRKLNTKDNCNM